MTTTPRTIPELQRELLAICKGGKHLSDWAKANGVPHAVRAGYRLATVRRRRVFELRREIVALDPKAAIYPRWCDSDFDLTEAEIRENLKRRAPQRHEALA